MSMKYFGAGCLAIAALGAGSAAAQDTIKIGMVMQMTGPKRGRQGNLRRAKLYVAQHGDSVAGKKIELIFRDDASIPDNAKRLAQELIVNDKVRSRPPASRRARWPWRRSPPKPKCRRW